MACEYCAEDHKKRKPLGGHSDGGSMTYWGLSYYDQEHERHGLGIGLASPPAFMAATDTETQKQVHYYADNELEQRYEQLRQVAIRMLRDTEEYCKYIYEQAAVYEKMDNRDALFIGSAGNARRDLEALGVNIDD